MSDQTPQQSNVPTIDFSKVNVTGLPGGGITDINGDATASQSLSALSPGSVSNNGVGGHVVIFPDFGPLPIPHSGLVSNPGAAGATDYLGADNTFRPIPSGGIPGTILGGNLGAQTILDGTPKTLATIAITATGLWVLNGGIFIDVPNTVGVDVDYLLEIVDTTAGVNIVKMEGWFPATLVSNSSFNSALSRTILCTAGHNLILRLTQDSGQNCTIHVDASAFFTATQLS